MDDIYDDCDDPIEARRRHSRMIDDLDRDIAEMNDPEEIARRKAAASPHRWDLPRLRLVHGVPTHRLTDEEAAYLDRHGF